MTRTVESASRIAATRIEGSPRRAFGSARSAGSGLAVPGSNHRATNTPRQINNKLKYGSPQPRYQADQPTSNGATGSTELPFRTSAKRAVATPPKEIRNEHARRTTCLQGVAREPGSAP